MNKINFFSVLVMLIAVCFSFQSCNNDADNFVLENSSQKYLDLNVDTNIEFTSAELNILKEAFQRIDPYIVVEDDKYVLTIQSYKELNMSETLFDYLCVSIDIANETCSSNRINIPMTRVKGGSEAVTTMGLGYYQTTIYLSPADTANLIEAMKTTSNKTEAIGVLIARNMGQPIVGYLMAAYGYFSSLNWQNVQNQYEKSGSNGAKLIETTFTSATVPYTTQQFIF